MRKNLKYRSKLLPSARKKFDEFLNAPTLWKKRVNRLHPSDWDTFYSFIDHSNRYNTLVHQNVLRNELEFNLFSNELIEELLTVYYHIPEFLNRKI
ncbi:MAG: hypothetical protein SFU91_06285 [Chloroherpetonaceae bacterium]|nr:hypothetical protein [Chloroherpetonaceae bacterium]